MEYRALGNTGLRASLAGLGTNNFGRVCDATQTAAVVHAALDLGVNFIDTADIYGGGLSEEFIGAALQGKRHEVVLATKFAGSSGPSPLQRGASRRYIMDAVKASLKRLNTDYIDLYQQHFWDANTPLEETVRALDDLVHQGYVRYVGCSNFAAWQIVEAQWIARHFQLEPFCTVQNRYNLLERSEEHEVVPVLGRYGLSLIPYAPLAGGFLTGKYRPGEAAPAGTRFSRPGVPGGNRALTEENFARLARLEAFAEQHDHTVGELALGWLGSQPFVGSVIAGATSPEQVAANVRALEWHLTPAELRELDAALGWNPDAGRARRWVGN